MLIQCCGSAGASGIDLSLSCASSRLQAEYLKKMPVHNRFQFPMKWHRYCNWTLRNLSLMASLDILGLKVCIDLCIVSYVPTAWNFACKNMWQTYKGSQLQMDGTKISAALYRYAATISSAFATSWKNRTSTQSHTQADKRKATQHTNQLQTEQSVLLVPITSIQQGNTATLSECDKQDSQQCLVARARKLGADRWDLPGRLDLATAAAAHPQSPWRRDVCKVTHTADHGALLCILLEHAGRHMLPVPVLCEQASLVSVLDTWSTVVQLVCCTKPFEDWHNCSHRLHSNHVLCLHIHT